MPDAADVYRIRPVHWVVFLVVLGLAAWARLAWPDATSLSFDELMSLHLSSGQNFAVDHLPRGVVLHDIPDLLTSATAHPWWRLPASLSGDVHPPLYYLALHFWRDLFGDSVTAVRALSALAGTLAVAATAFAGRELAGTRCGLLAAAAVAFAAAGIFYGHEVRMYALAMVWPTLAAGAMLRIERLSFNARRGAMLAGGLLASMLTLYLCVSVCAAIALYGLVRLRGRERGGVAVAIAVAALLFTFWLPFMLGQDWSSPKADWLRAPSSDVNHTTVAILRLAPTLLDQFGRLRTSDLWTGYLFTAVFLFLPPLAAITRSPRLWLPYLATLAAILLPTLRDLFSKTNMLQFDRYTVIALPFQTLAIAGAGIVLLRGYMNVLPAASLALYAAISVPATFARDRYDFRANAQFAEREAKIDSRRRVVVMTDGAMGYNGGLLLALCYYWKQWPSDIVLVDSVQAFNQLPEQITGDDVVLVAGHEVKPTRPFTHYASTGVQTWNAGAGYVMTLRHSAASVESDAPMPDHARVEASSASGVGRP